MKHNLHLLVIDPQNDFCDLPSTYLPIDPLTGVARRSALPVPGAHADMLRLSKLIRRGAAGLSAISVTLDSHHRLHIAHPTFWIGGDGKPVAPFTQIAADEVRTGKYRPRDPAAQPRVLAYLDALERNGRYRLMVWPVHCEIGTWGHDVHADLHAAYNEWEDLRLGVVDKISKGSNPWTEHYSALMAEVPDPDNAETGLNRALIASLASADRVYIAGEAGSHCVKATTEHLAEQFGAACTKLVLMTDCISAVSGFETQHKDFLQTMTARGVQIARSADVLADLLANV